MKFSLIIFSTLFLVASCGTTSSIKSANAPAMKEPSSTQSSAARPDLSAYDTVIVGAFEDGTGSSGSTGSFMYGDDFSALIAQKVKETNTFNKVIVTSDTEDTSEYEDSALLIEGAITRYAEGNATLRMLVGLGAGSSYFDANVFIKDFASKEKLADITVDKNSWALGGALAAVQDVDNLMHAASKKIAKEISIAKHGE